jgi:hypothetical protein
MRAASAAGMALDRRRGIDDFEFVAVLQYRDIVARNNGDYGKGRAVGFPAFGATTGVVVGEAPAPPALSKSSAATPAAWD